MIRIAPRRHELAPRALLLLLVLSGAICAASRGESSSRDAREELLFLDDQEVIAASKQLESAVEAPASIVVFSRETILLTGARTLGDLLRLLPGVDVLNRNGLASVAIRGLHSQGLYGSERVLLLIDGHRVSSGLYGYFPVDELVPLTIVDRVEVILGPASMPYGANALSGVINLVTLPPDEGSGAALKMELGTATTMAGGLRVAHQEADMSAMAAMRIFRSEGEPKELETDAYGHSGRVNRTGEESLSFLGTMRSESWTFRMAEYAQRRHLPISATYGLTDESIYRVAAGYGELLYEEQLEALDVSARLYADNWNYDVEWELFGEEVDPENYPEGGWGHPQAKSYSLGSEVQLARILNRRHRLSLGAEYRYEMVFDVRDVSNIGDSGTWSEGPFLTKSRLDRSEFGTCLQHRWDMRPWLSWNAAARMDWREESDPVFSPRLGAILQLGDRLAAKLIFGRSYRAPTFYELYADNPAREGNPDLQPERLRSLELVVDYRIDTRGSLQLHLHRSWVRHLIQSEAGEEAAYRYVNAGRAVVDGGELSGRWRAAPWMSMLLELSLLDDRERETEEELPYAPHRKGSAGVILTFPHSIQGSLMARYMGPRPRGPDRPGSTPGATCLDLVLLHRSPTRAWELRASVLNLTDQEVLHPGPYFDNPQPGRDARLELTVRF